LMVNGMDKMYIVHKQIHSYQPHRSSFVFLSHHSPKPGDKFSLSG